MTSTEQKLLDALIACRDRFAFCVGHHLDKGDLAKAAENEMFVALANEAIAAARQSEPPNFCARCGKRLTPDGVHTCTPPTSRDAELEQARTLAATAEKWRGLATAKFGDGRTVQEIQREAAEEEREACAKVAQSFEESGMEWAWDAVPGDYIAAAIRARGQK